MERRRVLCGLSKEEMKLLIDFDGVLTDQTQEATRVAEIFLEELKTLSRQDQERLERLLRKASEEVDQTPQGHGWRILGRISGFANEDPFLRNNGVADCLDRWASSGHVFAQEVLTALESQGVSSFAWLLDQAFHKMAHETHTSEKKPLLEESIEFCSKWIDEGNTLVICSNSKTDRILNMFSSTGLPAQEHQNGSSERFRVRGSAGKFDLGPDSLVMQVSDYSVEVSRPLYESLLLEEKPDLVVGDVFSIDLALPLSMARRGMLEYPHLLLKNRNYTPDWPKEFIEKFQGKSASLGLINQLEDIFTRVNS